MSQNYCLVIAASEIKSKLLSKLKKEGVSWNVITTGEGDELLENNNILLSYEGNAFPDLNKSFPNKILTMFIDGGDANYQINGSWELADSYHAGISLHMGYSLLLSDLKKIKKEKIIVSILKEIKDFGTMLTSESNDEVEQISHEVIIESHQELMKADALAKLLEKLANALTDKGYAHFIAWFDGSQAQKSGDLQESFLFPLAYADAFWDEEDGSQHRLHITNSEIFTE